MILKKLRSDKKPQNITYRMITKFKIFENEEYDRRYWKIPIDNYFFGYLTKLGVPEDIQYKMYDHYLDLRYTSHPNFPFRFVYVGVTNYDGEFEWDWNFDEKEGAKDFEYENQPGGKYFRQPDIELTEEEKEESELKINMKKYNL
jgi:hypothetical protein